jgi:hypothetical protein
VCVYLCVPLSLSPSSPPSPFFKFFDYQVGWSVCLVCLSLSLHTKYMPPPKGALWDLHIQPCFSNVCVYVCVCVCTSITMPHDEMNHSAGISNTLIDTHSQTLTDTHMHTCTHTHTQIHEQMSILFCQSEESLRQYVCEHPECIQGGEIAKLGRTILGAAALHGHVSLTK